MASVPGSNDSAKSKPKLYDGGIKDWKDGDRIAVKSYLFSNNLLEVVLHGVAPKASRTVTEQGPFSSDPSGTTSIGAGTKQSQFITPTAHQDGRRNSSTTASAQEYLEDLDITSSSTTTPSSPCSLRRELHKTKAAQEPNHNS